MGEPYDDDHDMSGFDRICDYECRGSNGCSGHGECSCCGKVVCGCELDPDTGLCSECEGLRTFCENCGNEFFEDEGRTYTASDGTLLCSQECLDDYESGLESGREGNDHNLVMRPTKEPVVAYEGVYSVDMNGIPLGLTVRARNAKAAEEKLRFVFEHELNGKRLDFKVEDYKKENKDENGEIDEGSGPQGGQENRTGDRGEGQGERVEPEQRGLRPDCDDPEGRQADI